MRWTAGAPRRLDETVSIGVYAERQNFRMRACEFGDCGAVACPEIDDYPFEAADQFVKLADVELGPLTSNDHVHGDRIVAHST